MEKRFNKSALLVLTVLVGQCSGQVQPITRIRDVINLQNELDTRPTAGPGFQPSRAAVISSAGQVEAVAGNSSDCVRVDGTAAPCGSISGSGPSFADQDSFVGVVDGVNSNFTIASDPQPVSSLQVFRNGLLQKAGGDYTYAARVITFLPCCVPKTGDYLQLYYRFDTSGRTLLSQRAIDKGPSGDAVRNEASTATIFDQRRGQLDAVVKTALALPLHPHGLPLTEMPTASSEANLSQDRSRPAGSQMLGKSTEALRSLTLLRQRLRSGAVQQSEQPPAPTQNAVTQGAPPAKAIPSAQANDVPASVSLRLLESRASKRKVAPSEQPKSKTDEGSNRQDTSVEHNARPLEDDRSRSARLMEQRNLDHARRRNLK